jgi:hypothetical protein
VARQLLGRASPQEAVLQRSSSREVWEDVADRAPSPSEPPLRLPADQLAVQARLERHVQRAPQRAPERAPPATLQPAPEAAAPPQPGSVPQKAPQLMLQQLPIPVMDPRLARKYDQWENRTDCARTPSSPWESTEPSTVSSPTLEHAPSNSPAPPPNSPRVYFEVLSPQRERLGRGKRPRSAGFRREMDLDAPISAPQATSLCGAPARVPNAAAKPARIHRPQRVKRSQSAMELFVSFGLEHQPPSLKPGLSLRTSARPT